MIINEHISVLLYTMFYWIILILFSLEGYLYKSIIMPGIFYVHAFLLESLLFLLVCVNQEYTFELSKRVHYLLPTI